MLFRKKKKTDISFDEILLDSSNLPSFNIGRMEGRIELPLSRASIVSVGIIFVLIVCAFSVQLFLLQVVHGESYAQKSEQNRSDFIPIIAERGIVYDRNGELLAWNELDKTGQYDFPVRAYTNRQGFGQLIGYVSYPQKDSSGFYYRTEYIGRNGVEQTYEHILHGENGKQIIEANVFGEIISRNAIDPAIPGKEITLSLDAELSEVMHDLVATTSIQNGFRSGAAAIMDIHTGEIIALTSYPSFDPEVLADGKDVEMIRSYNNDNRFPFLNKIIGGVYVPGSIVKPFVSYAALAEEVISPDKVIVSHGSITIPNPYNPSNPAIYRDWRQSLGAMTMRDAIAYSSNVYMMIIGGGFGDQRGIGITKMHEHYTRFGLGKSTGMALGGEQIGVVPSPQWKKEIFDDEWRLGDTYLTSIGQFGFQTTPIQMLRAYASLGNGGFLVTPHVIKGEQGDVEDIGLVPSKLRVIQEGMRAAVIQNGGTARSLERSDVAVAAKSGTAELGASKEMVNSWIAGYFPYEEPKYAFILLLENGPRANTVGASSVMGRVFAWMGEHRVEYFQ